MTTNKPRTYLDKVGRVNNHYFFISYSHEDSDYVYKQLEKLYRLNVNYWYDAEIEIGDVWKDTVKYALDDARCCGAILYLSRKSIASVSVSQEIHRINTKLDADADFKVFPVLLGIENYSELINILLQVNHPEFVGRYAKLLKDGARLFTVEKGEGSTAEIGNESKLLDNIVKAATECKAFDGVKVDIRALTNLSALMSDKQRECEFGKYPNSDENTSKIKWHIFNSEGSLIHLVTEFCLDFYDYETVFNPSKISPNIFGLEKESAIEEFSLIPKSVIEKYRNDIGPAIPTDYADSQRTQGLRLFWVWDDVKNELTLYNSINYEVRDAIPIENEKFSAGIRIYMVLDDNKLENYKKLMGE